MIRVHQYANCRRLGHELVQQLQPLCSQVVREKDHGRDVAARMVEVGDEAGFDRIAPGQDHHRDRRGRCVNRKRRSAVGDDHSHLPTNQITCQSRQPISLIVGPAVFDHDVLAFGVACFLQAPEECGYEVL